MPRPKSVKAALPAGLDLSRPTAPRWLAPPRLRKLGFKTSVALKHKDGRYMTEGEAFDAAKAINQMIADLEAGLPIRKHAWSHIAPDAPKAAPQSATSIGALIDEYKASKKFKAKAATTQSNYSGALHRLMETIAGFPGGDPAMDKSLPASQRIAQHQQYDDAMATAKATDIIELCTDDKPLQVYYDDLAEQINPDTGHPQVHNANAVLAVTSAWLTWVSKQTVNGRRPIPFNPARDVEKQATRGRVVIWEDGEIERVIAAARAGGWTSVAFAVELALELSWSQCDILNLKWGQLRPGHRVRGERSKTGNLVHTSLTEIGKDLFERMRAHYKAAHGNNIEPAPDAPILVADDIAGRFSRGAAGKPWKPGNFKHRFIDIKRSCSPPIEKTFQDLRDTAITRMKEAGLTDHEIQSRSQHSLQQIRNILDKHYGLTTLEIADDAAEKLNAKSRRRKR